MLFPTPGWFVLKYVRSLSSIWSTNIIEGVDIFRDSIFNDVRMINNICSIYKTKKFILFHIYNNKLKKMII